MIDRIVWAVAVRLAGLFVDTGRILDYVADPGKYHDDDRPDD